MSDYQSRLTGEEIDDGIEAAAVAAERAQQAEEKSEAAQEAAALADQKATPFTSYATALEGVGSLPTSIVRVAAIVSGRVIEWVRASSGPCLGGGWEPAGLEITPDHMGMTGGEADASPILQAMLDWIAPDPNRSIRDPFIGVRTFGAQLNSTGNVVWHAGVATYLQDHNARFFSATGNPNPVAIPISNDYVVGSKSIAVSLPVVPQRGDWIRIVSDALNPNDRSRLANSTKYRVQEFAQVGAGSTESVIQLERPLRFVEGVTADETTVIPSYTASANCRVVLFDTSKRFLFTGGRVEQTPGRTGSPAAIVFQAYFKPQVKETTFYRIFGSALFPTGTLYAHIDGCQFGDVADNELEPGQQGYGVSDGGEYTTVERSSFGKCRHAYSSLRSALGDNTNLVFSGGNTVGARVVGCVSVGANSRHFDTHHGSVGCSFIDCVAEGGNSSGFGGRGIEHVVRNCRTIMSAQGFSTLVEAAGVAGGLDRYATSFTVEGCDFQGLEDAFYARNSRVLVRNSTFRSPNMGVFRNINSMVDIDGTVRLINSTENGALPLSYPTADRWPLLVRGGSVSFDGAAITRILGTLEIDASEYPSLPVALIAVEVGTQIYHLGKIVVKGPDGVSLYNNPETRWIGGPTAELEISGDISGFSTGLAAGRIAYVYRAGLILDALGQEFSARHPTGGTVYRHKSGLQTCTVRQTFSLAAGDWTEVGGVFRAQVPAWSYPLAFAAAPANYIAVTRQDCWPGAGSGEGTASEAPVCYIWCGSPVTGSFAVNRTATGRFKSLASIPELG